MRTLLERLDWVLEHRGLTQLGWSKRAGLSTRYLSTLRGRLEAKPDARGDHDAMVKLATVAGVPVAWLEAAAILRRRGVPATPRAITEQVAVGSLPQRPRPVSADAEGDAKARELGVEPGSAAATVGALLKRK
jgi:hypothetical protein